MTPHEPSLRERSKAKRRAAIQHAAMRLFAERGYDRATLADIAEEAELAPRTVSTYFASKLDIAMSTSNDMADRLAAICQAHPYLAFTDLIDRWLVGEMNTVDPSLATLTADMFNANPELRAVSTSRIADATRVAGSAFVNELGLPAEHPMARIVGAALGGAISEYLTVAVGHKDAAHLHQAFISYLRAIITAAAPS